MVCILILVLLASSFTVTDSFVAAADRENEPRLQMMNLNNDNSEMDDKSDIYKNCFKPLRACVDSCRNCIHTCIEANKCDACYSDSGSNDDLEKTTTSSPHCPFQPPNNLSSNNSDDPKNESTFASVFWDKANKTAIMLTIFGCNIFGFTLAFFDALGIELAEGKGTGTALSTALKYIFFGWWLKKIISISSSFRTIRERRYIRLEDDGDNGDALTDTGSNND